MAAGADEVCADFDESRAAPAVDELDDTGSRGRAGMARVMWVGVLVGVAAGCTAVNPKGEHRRLAAAKAGACAACSAKSPGSTSDVRPALALAPQAPAPRADIVPASAAVPAPPATTGTRPAPLPPPGSAWAPLPLGSPAEHTGAHILGIAAPSEAAREPEAGADTRGLVPPALLPSTCQPPSVTADPVGAAENRAREPHRELTPPSRLGRFGPAEPAGIAPPGAPGSVMALPIGPPREHVVLRPTGTGADTAAPVVHVVNSKRFRLPSQAAGTTSQAGVMELWCTRDGHTWQRRGPTLAGSPPYAVEVEEDDLYGFTLVAVDGTGVSRRPQDGDRPQAWVEVDTTRPSVRVLAIEPRPEVGQITVFWRAADKNFGPRPIRLLSAPGPEGPWLAIAEPLENTGRYVWLMPAGLPRNCLIRVEAVDLAGNVGFAQAVARAAPPTASILGVEPTGQ